MKTCKWSQIFASILSVALSASGTLAQSTYDDTRGIPSKRAAVMSKFATGLRTNRIDFLEICLPRVISDLNDTAKYQNCPRVETAAGVNNYGRLVSDLNSRMTSGTVRLFKGVKNRVVRVRDRQIAQLLLKPLANDRFEFVLNSADTANQVIARLKALSSGGLNNGVISFIVMPTFTDGLQEVSTLDDFALEIKAAQQMPNKKPVLFFGNPYTQPSIRGRAIRPDQAYPIFISPVYRLFNNNIDPLKERFQPKFDLLMARGISEIAGLGAVYYSKFAAVGGLASSATGVGIAGVTVINRGADLLGVFPPNSSITPPPAGQLVRYNSYRNCGYTLSESQYRVTFLNDVSPNNKMVVNLDDSGTFVCSHPNFNTVQSEGGNDYGRSTEPANEIGAACVYGAGSASRYAKASMFTPTLATVTRNIFACFNYLSR